MQLYISLFGKEIPTYGLMIVIGVAVANLIVVFLLKKREPELDDFIILECYAALGGILGAKFLYLVVSAETIEWKRIGDLNYLNEIMQAGFVFYGGLFGGMIAAALGGKIHRLKTVEYMREFIFLLPLIHGFGRIGCFMAGCCFGIPYQGIGAVHFPKGSFAIPNIGLFPVQLVEACYLFILSFVLRKVWLREHHGTVKIYLISYGIGRFFMEFFRYDAVRGGIGGISTSQWISVIVIFSSLIFEKIYLKKWY